uniref:Amidase domain-containing protein n=1 Tax=Moniliophthora roreri TaxID=221103 RepID=A0A0W0FS10_MONRR
MAPNLNDLSNIERRLNMKIKPEDREDYLQLLAAMDAAAQVVLAMDGKYSGLLFYRFPRTNIHVPPDSENKLRGWACKTTVKGSGSGALDGRTICLKDNICLANVPCRFGTAVINNFVPEVDATVVTRILEAGGTISGKATCEDMSHGAASFTSYNGPVENPFAHGFSTGGSSSGCGALIGSGEVDMGIGGDQGGSIRIPASLCGIVGLKATFGLIPYTGVLSSEASLDHVGPMARNVTDVALLLQAIAGYDGIDDRQLGVPSVDSVPTYAASLSGILSDPLPLSYVKIGVLKEGFASPHLAPDVEAVVKSAINRFATLGAAVIEVSVPGHSNSGSLMQVLNKMGSSQARLGRANARRGLYISNFYDRLLPWNEDKWSKVHSFVKGTAISGEYAFEKYPAVYGRASNIVRKLKESYDAVLKEVDVIVMPTVPITAPRHVARDASPLAATKKTAGLTDNTSIFNGTGHPALSLPVGFAAPAPSDVIHPGDENIKLPVGLQIVGPWWGEELCLKVGAAWEAGWDWKTGFPR